MSSPVTSFAVVRAPYRRRAAARGAGLLAVLALGVGLTACGDAGESDSSVPSASASPGPLEREASEVKDAVAQGIGDQDVTAEAVRQTLGAAGWSGDDVEVSQNRTPTGLDVDKIEAGVHTAHGCVMVEVRPDHTVTVSTGAVLSTGRCLAGHAYAQ